ncbi:hypothetical protein D9757_003558 [Collybiopsis confluens]|uniref:Uncharacterized protein n=1 Tax=Collybiopsis confluens TaxID=2823264 RepID=A0A8H5HUN1_9AGAR|nr:hypothetical protein D9757_003558 [Collybiopsis confluens]
MESSSNIQRLELDKKAVERTARHRDYPSEQVEIKPDTDMLNEAKEAAIELMLKIIQIHAKVKRARRKLLRYELELGELSIDGVDLYEQLLLDEELLSTHIQKLPSLVPIDLTWVMIQEQVTRLDALNAGDLEHIPTVYSKATDCDDEKVTLQTQFQQVSVQYGPGLSREKAIQSSISSIWESVNAAGWSQSPIADDDHAIDDYHSSLSLAKLTLQRAIEEEQIVLSAESQVPSRNQPIVDRDSSATNSPSNRLLGHISPQSLQGLSPLSQLSHLTTTSTIVTNETGPFRFLRLRIGIY